MKTFYRLTDYQIENQNLSKDDIRILLFTNTISPLSNVTREGSNETLPLISHPDFGSNIHNDDTNSLIPSKNVVLFLEHIEAMPNMAAAAMAKDRRGPLPAVILTQKTKSVSGALLERHPTKLQVIISAEEFKSGHFLDILIFSGGRKERLQGTVGQITERPDRRAKGQVFFVCDITLAYGSRVLRAS